MSNELKRAFEDEIDELREELKRNHSYRCIGTDDRLIDVTGLRRREIERRITGTTQEIEALG